MLGAEGRKFLLTDCPRPKDNVFPIITENKFFVWSDSLSGKFKWFYSVFLI